MVLTKFLESSEILIVEDTKSSLLLLSDLLTEAGYNIRQAMEGELALHSIQLKKPDLILLDVRMPGVDGFEVCRRVKADSETANIPIIFLSALQDNEAKIQGLKLGASDYIVKPYEAEEVLLRVRTVLELRHLQHRLEDMCDMRTRQLRDEISDRRKIELELRESEKKLRDLAGYLEEVREEERKRIAREIHDELGQALTVINIDLSRAIDCLDEKDEKTLKNLLAVSELVQGASDTARSISENLRPGMLDLLGLGAALEHHGKRFEQTTGIECRLMLSDGGEFDIDEKISTVAYRIVQESLTNVARHAQASRVEVRVSDLNSELLIIVDDNGVGMPPESERKKNAFGLLGMGERVQLLGGGFCVESGSEGGTRIEASLPYSRRTRDD